MRERLRQLPTEAPEHLSEKAQTLWKELTATKISNTARQALLLTALEALNRAEEARLAIRESGMVSTTASTGAVHLHPLLKVERENKVLFAKIWGQLGLDLPGLERWP